MKWLWGATTAVAVTALVALGVLSVDERDVLWAGRQAICPYCRSDFPNLALTCPACRRTVDWAPTKETCRHCLSKEDADHLRNAFEALGAKTGPLPGRLASFPVVYFEVMQLGACTFCAGLGQVIDGDHDVPCPVCRGEGRCIACGGRRSVAIGAPEGWARLLERRAVWEQAGASASLTRLPINRTELVDADVKALKGFVEAEECLAPLLAQATERIRSAFAALHEELARKPAPISASPSGS